MKNLGTLILGLILGALAMYFYFNYFNQPTMTPPILTPKGIITSAEAKELSDNWTDLRKSVNDSVAYNEADNRSSWYSLTDLNAFLAKVAKDHPNADGIRFYLGVDTSVGTGGYTTVFMVPTQAGEREEGHDDITGADGLDRGMTGYPPNAAYPQ
ncbi:hypothetical protein [Olleya aquimaris]|uniref:Uncharacterized protein n=1 Tax=Olleya aquimaris TaxID=639310 RepID=A0A327RJS2_9FLAO|nr:hypothetical protein [Olleya aquimaris]RAJ17189.1 hypothetical protein LY08_00970 [Olleya aquimaris]